MNIDSDVGLAVVTRCRVFIDALLAGAAVDVVVVDSDAAVDSGDAADTIDGGDAVAAIVVVGALRTSSLSVGVSFRRKYIFDRVGRPFSSFVFRYTE